MNRLSKVQRRISTRTLLAGLAAAAIHPAFAEDIVFGELQLFDFDTFAEETRYGWTSGDSLLTDIDISTRIGGITGSKNKRISKAVKAWGVTIIPEIRADTRSGARLTSSLQATTGVVLDAGVTVGGEGFQAGLQAGPTLTTPGPVTAGKFFQLKGGSDVGLQSTFDPGLPKFDAGLDVVLNGSFDNKFEYGLFPIAKYRVGQFGFDFDLGFNLFDFDLDLNLPELPSINFPDLPDFDIPDSEDDNTLLRQKLPPSNPALSIAELAIDNPLKTIDTNTQVTEDGRLTTSTSGSIMRAGLDIDGVATALTTGVSFTGTSVNIGPGKFSYDTIDVKYGVELGIDYKTEIDPFFNATLDFKDEDGDATTVLVKNEDGSTSEISTYSGRWDELPEFALLTREDVVVDVDFTDIEAMFSHTGALTLSDYMELQALKASVKVGKLKLAGFGPLYYQKFPLAGEFADFELFAAEFSLGSISVGDLWDGSFTIFAAPTIDIALNSGVGSIDDLASWTELETGVAVSDFADKTLVIGTYGSGDMNRLDVTGVDYVDEGSVTTGTFVVSYSQLVTITSPRGTTTREQNFNPQKDGSIPSNEVLAIDGVVVQDGSSYTLADGGLRRLSLNTINNDGQIIANGYLGIENATNKTTIDGTGTISFNSPGAIVADELVHGEGHTINFNAFTPEMYISLEAGFEDYPAVPSDAYEISYGATAGLPAPVQSPTPFATQHVFAVNELDNAGTINFAGNDFNLVISQLANQSTGTLRVSDGRRLTLDTDTTVLIGRNEVKVLDNSGLIEATGQNSVLEIKHGAMQPVAVGDAPGRIVAKDGATALFSADDFAINGATIVAGSGGTTTFEGDVFLGFDATLKSEVGGTINLNGDLDVPQAAQIEANGFEVPFDIENAGTLNVNSRVSLRPFVRRGRDDPNPTILDPIGLTNTGTINISDGGSLEFGAVLRNFNDAGATLAEGVWNLNGADGDFSNLTQNNGATVIVEILGYENEEEAFFDIFGGVTQFDTTLRNNAATVSINGRSNFDYFNSVEVNYGTFNLSGGHQFTTAGQYVDFEGTTTVSTGADLFVQGALKVYGGTVDVDATSTLTALTQTEEIDDDGNTRDVTVEVIGGTLNIASSDYLAGTDMFSDRTDLMPEFNYLALEAGQAWIVREQVLIDGETEAETVIGGSINLGNAAIERNDGTIIIDGAEARFDAAERLRYNHGTLILQGGFEFNTLVNDFQNADGASMTLEGASFIVEGNDGTFRNDGSLIMDGDSYLFASHFVNGGVNGPSATLQLDGVLDAQLVTINAGSIISGSGMITGSIVNNGTLDLGNSPGLIESFGSYTQGADGDALFEIEGYEAGISYDQLVVIQVDPIEGEESQPEIFVTVDGTLSLAFDETLAGRYGFEWVLIDNQGDNAIIGEFDPIDVSGLTAGDPLNTNGVDTTGDIYLGDLAQYALFLSYTGGDGNDLTVYAVPEPSSLALMGFGGLALLRRRRRFNASA